jgi:hypothetical protein
MREVAVKDVVILIAPLLLTVACAASDDDFEFVHPTAVTIAGYSGDAMEPFITRDGRYLIFNNSNEAPDTDLHWAERIDDLTFSYRGKLDGANSSALDAVASIDSSGTIYFVSTRSYAQTLMTIYRGHFDRGVVTNVAPVPGLSRGVQGQVNFDVEVSADGSTLYFVDGLFSGGSVPVAADLAVAVRGDDGQFHRVDSGEFAAINTSALEYAACISENQLELFFTRIVDGTPAIFRATRADRTSPWQPARRLAAITGFVEGPTIAPGGVALYYHAKRNGRFVIERVTRQTRRRAATH